jgi:hypothetical protein
MRVYLTIVDWLAAHSASRDRWKPSKRIENIGLACPKQLRDTDLRALLRNQPLERENEVAAVWRYSLQDHQAVLHEHAFEAAIIVKLTSDGRNGDLELVHVSRLPNFEGRGIEDFEGGAVKGQLHIARLFLI